MAETITVAEAFEAFFAAKPHLAPVTLDNYGRTPRLYLGEWVRQPINKITRQMVLTRHQKISRERGDVTANNVMRHFRSVYNFVTAAHHRISAQSRLNSHTGTGMAQRKTRRRRIDHCVPPASRMVGGRCERNGPCPRFPAGCRTIHRHAGGRKLPPCNGTIVDLTGKTLHLPHTKNGDPLDLPISDFLGEVFITRRKVAGDTKWVFPGKGETGHLVETKSFTARVAKASGALFALHDLRRNICHDC